MHELLMPAYENIQKIKKSSQRMMQHLNLSI